MRSSPLPMFDRNLLRAVERIVPAAERAEWSRTWRAELWHMHHRAPGKKDLGITADLSIGLLCDALWLRTDNWGRALSGTPELCLASLLGMCLMAMLLGLAVNSGWRAFATYSLGPFERSVFAAVLVVFVSFATAPRGHIEQGSTSKGLNGLKRQMFFATKAELVLVLAFLLSASICQPLHASVSDLGGGGAAADVCAVCAGGAALGVRRPGAAVQAVPADAGDSGAGGTALAQPAGVERDGAGVQAGAWAAERSGDGDELVRSQPVGGSGASVGVSPPGYDLGWKWFRICGLQGVCIRKGKYNLD